MDTSINVLIGEKIRERRTALGMTQEELAFKMGYATKQSISLIELGKRSLTPDQLIEMAKALNTSYNYLLDDDPEPFENLSRDEKVSKIESMYYQLTPDQQAAVMNMIESIIAKPR